VAQVQTYVARQLQQAGAAQGPPGPAAPEPPPFIETYDEGTYDIVDALGEVIGKAQIRYELHKVVLKAIRKADGTELRNVGKAAIAAFAREAIERHPDEPYPFEIHSITSPILWSIAAQVLGLEAIQVWVSGSGEQSIVLGPSIPRQQWVAFKEPSFFKIVEGQTKEDPRDSTEARYVHPFNLRWRPSAHADKKIPLSTVGEAPTEALRFLEGVGERTPDWLRMNLVAGVVRDASRGQGGPIAVDDLLDESVRRLAAHGVPADAQHVVKLLGRLVDAKLLRLHEGRYDLALPLRLYAVKTSDSQFIVQDLIEALEALHAGAEGASDDLRRLIQEYAGASERWDLYPVESRWPILQAVVALNPDRQEQLRDFLSAQGQELRQRPLVDAILLLLEPSPPADWLSRHAPQLVGRQVYFISPEIWQAGGGLGRVSQYHTTAMAQLGAQVMTIEPYYPYQLDAENRPIAVDYSRLPIPIEDLSQTLKYDVTVKGKPVTAQVSVGRNRFGILANLIKDAWEYYTRAMYRYGQYGSANWEEFAEFFSRASLELVRRLELQAQQQLGSQWKAPVLIANDGQLGPLPIYRRLLYAKDPALQDALVWFRTHTRPNRGIFDRDVGRAIVEGMGIPPAWWPALQRYERWDFTSGGLRTADETSAVSAILRDEVAPYDPGARLVAITNGDDRARSAAVFRDVLRGLYGSQVNVEHVAPTQVYEAKHVAKQQLNLNPQQPVIAYAGRLVAEKASLDRAFTDENIEAMVKAGAQVILYANVQGSDESRGIYEHLKRFQEQISSKQARQPEEYPGRFIVRTGWGIEEQVALLAVIDVLVLDSDRGTEAAGFTEVDGAASGALVLAPPYLEGILQRQGIIIDRTLPGWGNTLIPEVDSFPSMADHLGSRKSYTLSKPVQRAIPM
jgi:glycogen synthase